MFTFVRDEVGASVPKFFFLASLSFFCLFLIIFFLFFFSSSSSSSFQKKQKALASQQRHTNEHTNGRTTPTKENQSIKSSSKIKNARRATLGRVLRRTRERARREAIERDRSSSGGEHREEQFRTRWVGQGILVILFSREKVNVGIADRFFLSAESASSLDVWRKFYTVAKRGGILIIALLL